MTRFVAPNCRFSPIFARKSCFLKFFEPFCKKKVILSSECWRYPILRVVETRF